MGFCCPDHRDKFSLATGRFDLAISNLSLMEHKNTECINTICPWSGDLVSSDACVIYRGFRVGFCSISHRDLFKQAISLFDARISSKCDDDNIVGKVVGVELHC